MIPNNFMYVCMYGVNRNRNTLHNILYLVGNSDIPQ